MDPVVGKVNTSGSEKSEPAAQPKVPRKLINEYHQDIIIFLSRIANLPKDAIGHAFGDFVEKISNTGVEAQDKYIDATIKELDALDCKKGKVNEIKEDIGKILLNSLIDIRNQNLMDTSSKTEINKGTASPNIELFN